MLLYLTSVAAQTLDAFVPYLPQFHPGLKVAFIPTAGDIYDSKPWQDTDRNKLLELGFIVKDVELKDKTPEQLQTDLADVDIIFVAGGNMFYLLEYAMKSGFMQIAKEKIAKGVIYIGSSAGSVLVGPDIEPVNVFDDPSVASLQTYEGMHIVDFIVLPHYTQDNAALYEKVQKSCKNKCIPLRNDQAIVVTEEGYTIIS